MNNEEVHIKLNEKKWDRWAESVDGKGWKYDFLRQAQESVISLMDLKENVNFLDIGCGTGRALLLASELVNNKGLFYGVDLSSQMLAKAEENFKVYDNFHFIKANAESIPLEDNYFDLIMCTNSFHHYLNPVKALKEMYRILKPGGKVYILDPTSDNLIIKFADMIMRLIESEHVKMYSTKEFREFYSAAGLKYLKTATTKLHQKIHIAEK